MKRILYYCILIALVGCITSCNSHSKEIEQMKKNLLYGPFHRGAEGSWVMEYDYYLTDQVTLKAKEYLTLKKDGGFKQFTEYYYDGSLMATEDGSGKWDIEYDDDLESYFFDQYFEGSLDIKNVSFNANWFKIFDTDKRMTFNGSLTDYDEDTLSGLEIIDCTPELFLIKNLSEDETYRYEPGVKYL